LRLEEELRTLNTIFLDTAPIIYYIEANPLFGILSKSVIDKLQRNTLKGFTSAITLTEVLVKPVETGRDDLVDKFITFLTNGKNLTLLEISVRIGEVAGRLRGKYPSIKALDALQISAAIDIKADAFLTNDKRLEKVSEIKVIVMKDYINKDVNSMES
jgi:predicted nucleic acid-binding protein